MFQLFLLESLLRGAAAYYRAKDETRKADALETASKWVSRFRWTKYVVRGGLKLIRYALHRDEPGSPSRANRWASKLATFLPGAVALPAFVPESWKLLPGSGRFLDACFSAFPNLEFAVLQPYLAAALGSLPSVPGFDPSNLIELIADCGSWDELFLAAGLDGVEGMVDAV